MKKHIIDLDKDCKTPHPDWLVETHKKQGKLEWNPKNIELYISEKQKDGYIIGEDLIKESGEGLNANAAEYLLEHQDLIPKEWQEYYLLFTGTILRSPNGDRYVEYLYFSTDSWRWGRGFDWIDSDFDRHCRVVRLGKSPGNSATLFSSDNLETFVKELKELIKKYE